MKPLIVVMAYNRPQALSRLLDSLAAAEYPPQVALQITIDAGGDRGYEVREVAEQFSWSFGEKIVRAHGRHLGLVDHFFYAGDRSLKAGSIVLLEDDLVVSPMFYHFAQQSLAFTRGASPIG